MSFIPDCRDMSRRLCEALDGGRALGLSEHVHLWMCDVCRRLRLQLAVLAAAVRAEPESGPALSSQSKERLRHALGGSSSA